MIYSDMSTGGKTGEKSGLHFIGMGYGFPLSGLGAYPNVKRPTCIYRPSSHHVRFTEFDSATYSDEPPNRRFQWLQLAFFHLGTRRCRRFLPRIVWPKHVSDCQDS